MKTKTKHIYICQICGKEFDNEIDCKLNEAKCLGLTIKEYDELCSLLKIERESSLALSSRQNEKLLKAQDIAIKNVTNFLNKHNIGNNLFLDLI